MLTKTHIAALMPLIDAGLKASGVQVFAARQGAVLQEALNALEQIAQQEIDNGNADADD